MVQKSDGKPTDMEKQTETEIAEGLRQGNRDAWLTLYDLYAEKVWCNVARLMGGDPASVADIVQETFRRIYSRQVRSATAGAEQLQRSAPLPQTKRSDTSISGHCPHG